ncbi:WD40-repeat-containing domain protein [Pilobolus umbonatus]|nr:WD40-repeat-containing domain protein [Pilobolus umbonatus]
MSRNKKPVSYQDIESDIEIEDIDDINVDEILTDDLLETSDEEYAAKVEPIKKKVATKKKMATKKEIVPTKKKSPTWNSKYVTELAKKYPDSYWKFHADSGHNMINLINEVHALDITPCYINDQAPITSMSLSEDGALLATFSNIGAVKIWDIGKGFTMIQKLRDHGEFNIDEFYCGQFVASHLLIVGGKLKDRHRWSTEDEDNHILPCPLKIFDVVESKVVATLEGHAEEILDIKTLQFKGENYYISTSQDGHIIKWHMEDDWITLKSKTKMVDNITCMAFTVSFVPDTGNKYFIAATDEHLRLYDFENAEFVKWLDEPLEELNTGKHAWFISRGAEMCDVSEGVSSKPSTCTLHKLIYPSKPTEQFKLVEVKRFQHPDYHSNSWLVKITSNGRYILAPTIYGQVFVFNMLTGQVTAILKEHQDGCVKVYTYKRTQDEEEEDNITEIEIE